MKLRYKAPSGGGTLDLSDDATVQDLLQAVKSSTGYSDIIIKYGWPPQTLSTAQIDIPIQSLGLSRESLTVVPNESSPAYTNDSVTSQSKASIPVFASEPRGIKDQNITVSMPESGSTLVLRVMPDDNSCLFTAVAGALRGLPPNPEGYTPEVLRRLAVEHIRDHPEKFDEVVLEKSPEAYCARMLRPDTWGGAIELGIFSEIFKIEICSVDVKTNSVIRYGDGKYDIRCVLVYSNIHYDRVAETFVEEQEVADFDVTRWNVDNSDHIIAATKELCKKLKEEHHYYTDTSDFVVLCNECGWIGQGEKSLAEHSLKTGHSDVQEIADS